MTDMLHIAEYLIFTLAAFVTLYLMAFSTAGLFRPGKKQSHAGLRRRIAVMVPGYKEDNVILATARESRNQTYPKELYDVYILADSFLPETLAALRELDVRVIEVTFEASSKAKALNFAMQVITEPYEVAVILDADNIMAPRFLEQVDAAFGTGFRAVQGHRTAKNTNTPFAILDAISEEINNHIFRQGHRALGLSSALIGSGMAFDYGLYRETMKTVTSHGEDKELEMKLLKDGITIEYLPDALVYDEKIQKAEVFGKQRKRWLAAQFGMFRQYAGTGMKQLVAKGNLDLFDKVVQMMLPPRVLHLGFVTILLLVAVLFAAILSHSTLPALPLVAYAALWAGTLAALLTAVPRRFYNAGTLRALRSLPGAFMIMLLLLFRLRGAGKSFIHTPHGTTEPHKH